MNRLLILAALLLSVVGGLTLMSSSSPLAAQTDPSATRSVDSSDVEPGATVTVTITLADDYEGRLARVTERLDAGLAYVAESVNGASLSEQSDVSGGVLRFNLFSLGGIAGDSFTYQVTASDTDGDYDIEGDLTDAADMTHSIEATTITVSTTPVQTGPQPEANDLQFDVVPSKAVKDAEVSQVGRPIASNPLTWVIDTEMTLGDFDGSVGDFEVRHNGDGEFGLFVVNSGAPNLSGSQSISVDLTYTNADGDELTSTLTGGINMRSDLSVDDYAFTIPQGISDDTLIGAFTVGGGISGEYLDGILTGTGSDKFSVNDTDMTLTYKGGGLDVGTYDLQLTVSGDAGLANRTAIADVDITVTASNMAPTVPATFTETIEENNDAIGTLVDAGTAVGDASADVSASDGDTLTYSLDDAGDAVFDIDSSSGAITVGDAITDDAPGGTVNSDGDVVYNFLITVSDGITANDRDISATVTVDANAPAALTGDAAITLEWEGTEDDVPDILQDLHALVSDADDDTLTFDVTSDAAHIVHDRGEDGTDDVLLLTYLPPGANPGPRSDEITVNVSDGWNDDGADTTIIITVEVTELQPPPVTSEFVSITVAENGTDCVQEGVASGCSLADEVDAYSYSIESGVEGGDTNYAVDSMTGAITVLNEPNFEDGLSPAFLVNANNSDGSLAGLISVRVTVTDVDEPPVITAIPAGDVPWVYENFQIDDAVVTKVASQNAPDAVNDPETKVIAMDPEGRALTYTVTNDADVPFTIDSDGVLRVDGTLEADDVAAGTHKTHDVMVSVSDPAGNATPVTVTVTVLNSNESPNFTAPLGDDAVKTINENTGSSVVIFTFTAQDEDGDDLSFSLREGQSQDLFEIRNVRSAQDKQGNEIWHGDLHAKSDAAAAGAAAGLNYEYAGYDPRVHVEVNDPAGLNDTLLAGGQPEQCERQPACSSTYHRRQRA